MDPTKWHQVAVTFRADLNVLNLGLDGRNITYVTIPAHTAVGNNLASGDRSQLKRYRKCWLGKIEDVRIWNVAHKGADISATYTTEFTTPQQGLVANWQFNESLGDSAADVISGHTAQLHGRANVLHGRPSMTP